MQNIFQIIDGHENCDEMMSDFVFNIVPAQGQTWLVAGA